MPTAPHALDPTAKLLEYGRSLYELRRFPEAEAQMRQFLSREPQNWSGHYYLGAALLAQSLTQREKIKEGLQEAKRAITLQPDNELGYFLMAWAYLIRRESTQALDAVHQGLRINPASDWGYAQMSRVYYQRHDWANMLQAAQTGLRFAPDHVQLLNLQAEAFILLDRPLEARAALEMALRSDPSSAEAHANRGWLALYDNTPAQALPHFREALRLDPTSEISRQGLLRSLHARNPLYRLLLRYYMWTTRLTHEDMLGTILLISGIHRVLWTSVVVFPPLLILVFPFFILYRAFSFFTWVGEPFFNLLLRLSPSGRVILTQNESASAFGCGFIGLLVLINIAGFIAALFLRPGELNFLWIFFLGAFLSFGMIVPIVSIFNMAPSRRKRRAALSVLAALLGANALCSWSGSFSLAWWHWVFLGLFVFGSMLYPWIANLIISLED